MTYDPPSMTTMQEVFDYVVRHLIRQRCRSVNADGACCYRGSNGTACAAGCLISDKAYAERAARLNDRDSAGCIIQLENASIWSIRDILPPALRCFAEGSTNLIPALQHAHDGLQVREVEESAIVASWPGQFRQVATRFLLDAAVVPDSFQ